MSINNRYVAIEGVDGAGKGFVSEVVRDYIESRGLIVTMVAEPGTTEYANICRQILKDPEVKMVPESEFLLFCSARTDILAKEILPVLKSLNYVVSDRCFLSSIAYQGWAFKSIDDMEAINNIILPVRPGLIFYLDVDPTVGMARVVKRGEKDRIESRSDLYFEGVHKRYRDYANSHSEVITIDANATEAEVSAQVIKHLKDYLEKGEDGWLLT